MNGTDWIQLLQDDVILRERKIDESMFDAATEAPPSEASTGFKTVPPEKGGVVGLPTTEDLWRGVNEIRAEILLPPAAEGTIQCTMTLASRSPGFQANDGYWFSALVSPRAGNFWEGWRELRMPAEAFYTAGIPAGWTGIQSVRITLPPGGRIRNIRLLEREVAAGPRMTDRALASALDPDHPGLSGLRDGGDPAESLRLAAAHFRRSGLRRTLPRLRGMPEADLKAADEVAAGTIMGHDWSRGIDWLSNPVGYIEWSIRIHMLHYLDTLVAAIRSMDGKTGETEGKRRAHYGQAIEAVVADWMARNPVPYGVRACGLAWGHSLVVAIRAYNTLVDVFSLMCARLETKDRTIIDLLKSIWEHASYLLAFESFPPSNKTIAEARTVLALGCAFPEFRAAAAWREEAARRLAGDMEIQVFPDGGSYELSPGYQLAIADWFTEAYRTAEQFSFPLGTAFAGRLRGMYTWLAAMARPDFSRPATSDAGSLDGTYGEEIAQPARLLAVPEAVWVGTGGREGHPPGFLSVALPDSGYFIMRGGWDRQDCSLLFKAGSYGRAHQHEDNLSFDLYALGTPFLVDPGISSYLPDSWTGYYRSTAAHNTVLVDGRGQDRRNRQRQDDWNRGSRGRNQWISGPDSDWADGRYDAGFRDLADAVSHYRGILFVKPRFYVVFDELSGSGNHLYEALFHLMPFRAVADPAGGAVRTVRHDAANMEILSVGGVVARLVCGSTDPVQGWVSINHQDVPAPTAVFSRTGALPFRCAYVLYPFPESRVTAEAAVTAEAGGDLWRLGVATPEGSWRVEMDWAGRKGTVRPG